MRNDELKLRDYGLEYISPDPIMHMPFADGSYITQWADLERTAAEFAKFSKKDGDAYLRMYHESEAARDPPRRRSVHAAGMDGKVAERASRRRSHGQILAAPPGHVPVGSPPRKF